MDQQATIDALVAEKTALDQSYVTEIRTCLELRKQHLMKDKYIEDLNKQIQTLLNEKEDLNKQIQILFAEKNQLQTEYDTLKNSMSVLESDAQSIEG